MDTHIVILNYNGEKLLARCLPSIVLAARRAQAKVTVTVLDNLSQDESLGVARQFGQDVRWVQARANRVLCSYNDFLREIDEAVVILLNNDVQVAGDFVDPLIEPFQTGLDVFMAAPKILSFDGRRFESGRTRFRLKYGIFWASARFPGHEPLMNQPGPTMAAGFGAFDRKKFLELGGYDDLYLPGRLEDSDLCFRAWRRGWRCLYEPRSVVFHAGGESFHAAFGREGTLVINHRNSFLFLWKNLEDPWMSIQHWLMLPLRLAEAFIRGRRDFLKGFAQAVPLWRTARRRRREERQAPRVRSDREIFGLV